MTGDAGRGIHDAAARGFSAAADTYERGRPGYPAAAVAHLVAALGVDQAARVVDVGAGTGKLTRLLVPEAAEVVAVEPVAAMRAALAALVPGCAVVAGTAEALPLKAGAADAAVAGQAFHWFDAAVALRELHRVLRPGGGLGLMWNRRGVHVGWMAELSELFDAHAGDAPIHRDDAWLHAAFEGREDFTPLDVARFNHDQRVSVDRALDRLASVSFVAAMTPGDREPLLARAAEVMRPHVGAGGLLEMPYVTDVYTSRAR